MSVNAAYRSVKISTLSPYNDNSCGSFHFNGEVYSAIEFAGSTVDSVTDFNLGSGSEKFTHETWALWNAYDGTKSYRIGTQISGTTGGWNGNTGHQWLFFAYDDKLYHQFWNGTALTSSYSTFTPVLDQWYHLAVVYDGTDTKVYLDGTAQYTMSSPTYGTNSPNTNIPVFGSVASYNLIGSTIIQTDHRIVKGHNVYSSNFTPPTTALSNVSGTGYSTIVLMQPGNDKNTHRDVSAPEEHKFAVLDAHTGQEPITVINDGTAITSTGALTATYNYQTTRASMPLPAGKWYVEVRDISFGYLSFGLWNNNTALSPGVGNNKYMGGTFGGQDEALYYSVNAAVLYRKPSGGTAAIYHDMELTHSPASGTGDIYGFDFDTETNTFGVTINGSGRATHTVPTSDFVMLGKRIALSDGSSGIQGSLSINFGENPTFNGAVSPSGGTNSDGSYPDVNGRGSFRYSPPTGYAALTKLEPTRPSGINKAALNPQKYFDTVLYAGNGIERDITLGFRPDFVWGIPRDASPASGFFIYDSVRGASLQIESNGVNAESVQTTMINNFDVTNGFTMGTDTAGNKDATNFVAWCWKAGGDPVFNNDGSSNSLVSANKDAGFSIVAYKGTGANATVGHGLSRQPEFIISKNRTGGDPKVYHIAADNGNSGDYQLYLNDAAARADNATIWNDKNPDSRVFHVGTGSGINQSDVQHIAYCWHSVEGFSKMGFFESNASDDGPFVNLGFRPAWLMIKAPDYATNWAIHDNKRDPDNYTIGRINANLAANENRSELETTYGIDFLSNGFKIRADHVSTNRNGTWLYVAYAEAPTAFTNGR